MSEQTGTEKVEVQDNITTTTTVTDSITTTTSTTTTTIEETKTKETEIEHTGINPELTLINNPIIMNKLAGYQFFEKILKSPKKIVAPMVDHTYLAFRMLCRKYGSDMVYTPMMHSKNFATQKVYRKDNFSTCPEDRPLVVQFCGNEPEWVVKAAKYVENDCDAIDLNLGCPQQIARRGNYGSFLLDKPHIILPIVRALHQNIKVPIFCKIRLLPNLDDTIKLAKDLQDAGCQLLTVHGRTKEQKGQFAGVANWDAIARIKKELTIPVIANGSVLEYEDIDRCLNQTGADGVMSADGILANPAMFSGLNVDTIQVARDYLELCHKYPTQLGIARSHLFKMLKSKLDLQADLRDQLHQCATYPELSEIVEQLDHRIKTNAPQVKVLSNKEKRELKAKQEQEQKDQNTTTTTDNTNNNNKRDNNNEDETDQSDKKKVKTNNDKNNNEYVILTKDGASEPVPMQN
ncbi:tRNA-dihydrouridine synthase 1-like protein [Tieghemostelium lacteum]|uniref:tRNA-dihydrouridine(16/17) synthase [NAD(P)(+)] n=1 Tax=Tieghemostelium lacteum TaxID=361077 RepID=A0A151ZBG5_TIELA|nr:tRNA-dihydrouridine synthase 1-like protein [Tieghemostelium lacteum]|eukprot:KYQ91275.1 tRNA-dihydrouridine synthase 1-like protein [Tieghemostelium lacteum]